MTTIERNPHPHCDTAITEHEKGTHFGHLGIASFLHDPTQTKKYQRVWLWSERANDWDGEDVGIDLGAQLSNALSVAATRAKFHVADTLLAAVTLKSAVDFVDCDIDLINPWTAA